MTYQYQVRDPLGNVYNGSIDAASADEATQQLRRDGFQVVQVEESDGDDEGLFGRISKNEIIYATAQLAIMVDTGITLSAALGGIMAQEQNPTLRKVLGEIKTDVEEGDDFSTALARHPKFFDRTYVSLVKASEATGSLGPMLERIASTLRKELESRNKVRSAMTYPGVMMAVAIGVTIFLLTYILPKFVPLFKSRGAKLPKPTQFMMAVSDVMLHYWYLWLAAAILTIVGLIVARRTGAGRRCFDWLKINAPVVGPMCRKIVLSRCIRTLGTMLASGVPMLDALKLCSEVADNYFYEKAWEDTREQVTAGKRICEVLAGSPLFPRVLVQMISSGEETGRLDYVLQRVSVYYDQEVETSLKTTTSLIEPVMISVMGVVVGMIGLSLLLPIFSLSRPT